VNPSDRFLNRTLGGGVTLDVGCYLVELALLAACDHRQSHRSLIAPIKESKRNYLRPDGIVATGHGVYRGLSFPVDVESSFSLRWGGGSNGIAASCEYAQSAGTGFDASHDSPCEKISIDGKTLMQDEIQSTGDARKDEEVDFTMVASFQASFRRPSTFGVEYIFEKGRVLVDGPGNCPSEMTIFEHTQPFGPLVGETKIRFPLPQIKDALLEYGRPNYPRPEGFVYVIDAIEECMREKGVPGKVKGPLVGPGCLELEENTIEEQLVTVDITEEVLKKMDYFG